MAPTDFTGFFATLARDRIEAPPTVDSLRTELMRRGCVADLQAAVALLSGANDEGSRRVAQRIGRFLSGEIKSLPKALGISAPRGSHRTAQALASELKKTHRDEGSQ